MLLVCLLVDLVACRFAGMFCLTSSPQEASGRAIGFGRLLLAVASSPTVQSGVQCEITISSMRLGLRPLRL